ncbi:hypothetical protein STEG23_030934 [Scotinomys teguina]
MRQERGKGEEEEAEKESPVRQRKRDVEDTGPPASPSPRGTSVTKRAEEEKNPRMEELTPDPCRIVQMLFIVRYTTELL